MLSCSNEISHGCALVEETVMRADVPPSAAIELSRTIEALPPPLPENVCHGDSDPASIPPLTSRFTGADPLPIFTAGPSGDPRLKSYSSYHQFTEELVSPKS